MSVQSFDCDRPTYYLRPSAHRTRVLIFIDLSVRDILPAATKRGRERCRRRRPRPIIARGARRPGVVVGRDRATARNRADGDAPAGPGLERGRQQAGRRNHEGPARGGMVPPRVVLRHVRYRHLDEVLPLLQQAEVGRTRPAQFVRQLRR